MKSTEPSFVYLLLRSLQTPSHITSLSFGHTGHLYAGSDDGSLRVYDLSSFRVLKAIRGLGSEVSSVICLKRSASEFRDVWLGCGRQALLFRMDTQKMILTLTDVMSTIDLGEKDDDNVNELTLNSNKSHLAFCLDSGVVGVVDLSTKSVSKMKTKHQSICVTVKFIPDRPRELVSSGCDSAILHFDFLQGTMLSQRDIPAFSVEGGVSFGLPFVMCAALSTSGIIAAGTADGQLWLGLGGEKHPSARSKKKRKKKWEGLKEDTALLEKAAEGPIVAMAFSNPNSLMISTLLGKITQYHIVHDDNTGSVELVKGWQMATKTMEKVNALIMDNSRVIVGGLTKDGKGVVEVWNKDDIPNGVIAA